MARKQVTVPTAVWRSGGALSELEIVDQWAYLMLMTQSDITAAGVLALSPRRWATRAADASPALVMASINRLAAHGLVVFDEDTEELLLPAFIDWDGGSNNSKRRPAIAQAARDVESPAIRKALATKAAEFGFQIDLGETPASRRDSRVTSPEVTALPAATA